MINVETDTTKAMRIKHEADFTAIAKASSDVQEFTSECGIELKSAVLGAIVAAQDEYIRIIQSKTPKELPVDLKASLKETIAGFARDIDDDEINEFRELVTG